MIKNKMQMMSTSVVAIFRQSNEVPISYTIAWLAHLLMKTTTLFWSNPLLLLPLSYMGLRQKCLGNVYFFKG